MKLPHAFEFLDLESVPSFLKTTERELLEGINSAPFRRYSKKVADKIVKFIRENEIKKVVELGAGSAPLTEYLLKQKNLENVQFVMCDLEPDTERYRDLENKNPGRVSPIYEPVDFTQPRDWGSDALLVLSQTFHHIPSEKRVEVIRNLSNSAKHVMICEGLRKNIWSVLLCLLAPIPCLFVPIMYFKRPGAFRRFVFTWLLPIPVFMLVFDGVISSMRMWSYMEWEMALAAIGEGPLEALIISSGCTKIVSWSKDLIHVDR